MHRLCLENIYGVEVISLEPGSPAAEAGIKAGDLILAINQSRVECVDDLHHFLAEWPVGMKVTLTVLRKTVMQTFNVIPAEAGVVA
ncbi:MAG: PDZ domain-containing protein [Methanomicrobiales archaeon]|nr:PDZ domain-containing protein [Methanomicrobiales archaeon]